MRIIPHLLTILDSYYKGYQRGTPDLELKCKVGDSVDVVAIELKFGSNVLSIEQEDYLDKLNKIKDVKTIVLSTQQLVWIPMDRRPLEKVL